MRSNIIYIASVLILIASCEAPKSTEKNVVDSIAYNQINKAYFFIGEWENKEKDGLLIERWQKLNDSVFVGESYFVSNNDTLNSEKIRLEQRGKELYFIPIVKGQNNNQPVEFKLTKSSNNQMVFENQQHDFPTKISYSNLSSNSMSASVSGIIDGKQTTHSYRMKRCK
ncbi:MAG: DUF6265 family protein [Bacteroidia bacterium]